MNILAIARRGRALLPTSALLATCLVQSARADDAGELSSPGGDHVELANLHFSNGNVVRFVALADGEELHIAEITRVSDDEQFLIDDGLRARSPLEIFLALTSEDVAVPEAKP